MELLDPTQSLSWLYKGETEDEVDVERYFIFFVILTIGRICWFGQILRSSG
jgi:hypothetical protein